MYQELEDELKSKAQEEVKRSMQRARSERKPHVNEMFKDVYDELPKRLQAQQKEMWEVVNKYKKHYPLESYEN
jgi:TPP-dependent pyruvate/acetoin dehydrogenase alpha subunit